MVRRGSTVRVRQSSLQSPCKSAFFLLAPLAELPTCARYGAVYGARRVRKLVRRPPRRWAGRVGCSVVLEGRLLALVVRVSRLPQPVRAGTAARSSQPQRGECLASACGQPTVRPPRFGSSVVPTAPPFHRASGTVGHSTVRVDEHQPRFVRVEDEVVGGLRTKTIDLLWRAVRRPVVDPAEREPPNSAAARGDDFDRRPISAHFRRRCLQAPDALVRRRLASANHRDRTRARLIRGSRRRPPRGRPLPRAKSPRHHA
jgi:hypothetical protein